VCNPLLQELEAFAVLNAGAHMSLNVASHRGHRETWNERARAIGLRA